ncbi:MAG: molybdopterin-dependent oxidoreductase [Microthrixaceae bacterium]|nr:molybdopterin-dependent oxidoreductase [Microthrixaceae bacterium]
MGARTTPVTGSRIAAGLFPCNLIPEEILTDHPDRFRAIIVESGNPLHSLADSPAMREAFAALDLVVVIDVFMTETARHADYVLPVPTQFEKLEATFFNFEFPRNVFHLRRAVLDPPRDRCTKRRSTHASSRPPGPSTRASSSRSNGPQPTDDPRSRLRSSRVCSAGRS